MKVYKFGGASVKDAQAVKNVGKILETYGKENPAIVISAMGKMTNALEEVWKSYLNQSPDLEEKIKVVKEFHFNIIDELFDDTEEIHDEIENLFFELEFSFESKPSENADMLYDRIVSYGEILSTKIISEYLNKTGYKNKWIDIRNFIITDNSFREARVYWNKTENLIRRKLIPLLEKGPIITQGFIGSTGDMLTTTLGREGSDYTASILAFSLNAVEVTVWKDVPGILNADPKKFENTVKFDEISFQEAIEMTFYGSKVLHPKTIKPLQNKHIPLMVKSFLHPADRGTKISETQQFRIKEPIIILKEDQSLISLSSKDYSFISEESLSRIFHHLAQAGLKMNLMNSSAISFAFCVDDNEEKIRDFSDNLSKDFEVHVENGLRLLTIRHCTREKVKELTGDKKVRVEHSKGDTIQLILEN